MKKKQTYINWDKCIHVHACRRFATIVERKTGKKVARGCGKNCEAYEEGNDEEIAAIICDAMNFKRWRDTEARGDDVECYQKHVDKDIDKLAEIYEVELHSQRIWDYDRNREVNDPIYDSPKIEGYDDRVKEYKKNPLP